MKAQILKKYVKTEQSFSEIFVGLYVCFVVATTLKTTKVFAFPNYAVCWEWLSPPHKVNEGLSQCIDKFRWPFTACNLLRKHKCIGKLDIAV